LRKQYPDSLYLFPGHKGPSISERGIHDVVAQAGREAGLAFPVHPHMLRHGCGYALINKGTDVRVIQSYMGHVSIQSTVRYTHVDHSQFNGLWE
jgi:type 1 fimbriae regulatory protein FimB/type 1 fimbriae regulatory protein FimE